MSIMYHGNHDILVNHKHKLHAFSLKCDDHMISHDHHMTYQHGHMTYTVTHMTVT